MKKILLLSAAICFSISATTAQVAWSSPLQVDDDAGTFPKLSFDPNGRLSVFYYDIQRDSMFLKKEKTPTGTLSSRIRIINGGKNIGIYYASAQVIDLLVSRTTAHSIFQSTDSGSTWSLVKTFGSSDNAGSANTMGACFTEDGAELRLFYSFVHYSAVTGDRPQTFELKRVNNVWGTTGTFITDGGPIAAYENGQDVCVNTTRGTYFSSNNGLNYSGFSPDRFDASGGDISNGTIYLLKDTALTTSSDNGANWASPKIGIISTINNVSYSKIAVNGDTMVVCWPEEQISQAGVQGYKYLLAKYSIDGGSTFSDTDTLFAGTNFKVICSSLDDNRIDFDIVNHRNRFVVTYAAVLNNLANNQHTYLREINFPNVSPPVTDINEIFENEDRVIYPNPANEVIKLQLPGNGSYDLLISDDQGRTVMAINQVQPSSAINVQELTNGLYFLRITSEGATKVYKFAINR